MRRLLSIALLSLIVAFPLSGGAIRHYTEREGLPGNRATDVTQDSRGFIWVCNRNAVSRFDGSTFLSYSLPLGEEDYFFDNICPSQDGKIWVATTNKLLLFDPGSEQFSKFASICPDSDGLRDIRMMSHGPDGRLWLSSISGIFAYSGETGELKRYSSGYSLACANDGDAIWVADYKSVFRYDDGADRLEEMFCLDISETDKITVIYPGTEGCLWVGTWDGCLFKYEKDSGRISGMLSTNWPAALKRSRIHDIYENSPRELILATDSGLFLFDKAGGDVSLWEKESEGDSYYKIFQDRENGIWIATYFNGLEYISPRMRNIGFYTETGVPGSLKGTAVSDFCEDEDGNVWVSTENGGLSLFDTGSQTFKDYSTLSYNNIHALLLDGRYLWMGTFSHGLERMDLRTGSIRRFRNSPSDGNSICDDHIYSLCKSRDGNILVATLHGICVYDKDTDSFRTEHQLGRNFYTDIMEASDGTVWAASKSSGIWMKTSGGARWTHFFPESSTSLPLQTDRVNKILEGNDGTIYAATDNAGILFYEKESGAFRQLFTDQGLPAVSCYGVLQDEVGNLWISSNSGILKFHPEKGLLGQFSVESGMQGSLFNLSSCYMTSDGKMWFGGVNGFNCFYPSDLNTPTASAPPVITFIDYRENGREVRRALPESCPVLHWKSASLTVSFCATNYPAPSQTKFQWRMDGYNSTWTETAGSSVSMFNIRPGKHLFQLRACNSDGVWSPMTAELQVVVLRNPFLRWWAVIIYIFAVGFITVWTVRTRLKEKKLAMERETVQAKIDFFGDVAHEIKTPVTLIKAPLEQVIDSGNWSDSDKVNLEIIRKNTDRLMELVRQLLDFRKVDKTGFEIRLDDADPCLLARSMTERFQPVDGRIRIVCETPEQGIKCRLDREAVTKMLSNLLMNALKYARSRIVVRVSLKTPDTLELSVVDDGPGIPEESIDDVFKPFFQVNPKEDKGFGIGLSLVRLLAEKHQGKVSIRNVPESGCSVTISLPFIACGNPTAVSDPLSTSERKETMLVVEDTADMMQFLVTLFSKDWTVIGARDGNEALEILEREQVDFIVSDLMMPGLDGLGLLKAVRSDSTMSALPFILLTAKDDSDTKITALEAGADAYIEKPFSPVQMLASVEGILSVRRRVMEKYKSNPETGFDGIREEDAEWLKAIDDVVTENLDSEDLGVNLLSMRLSTGRTAFQKRLKALTGMTASEYIKVFRLKKAAAMIRDGRYRIGEISYMVGFSDQSYFTKCFTNQFGVLPKDYAK